MAVAYKLIFFQVVHYLARTLHNHQLLPQDFADSLASHLSATLASALLVLVMARMFFFEPIECLTPSEWPESWEKAAEASCFIEGAYAVPEAGDNLTDGAGWGNRRRLGYYYWIPHILIGQAVLLKAPDFFWHYLCDLHPKRPAATLKAFAFLVGSQEVVTGKENSGEMLLRLTNCDQRASWSARLADHLLSRNGLINFDSWHLFAQYLVFKVIRLAALLLSLLYLKAAFGLDSVLFGASLAASWQAELFPRWAFCDVHVRLLGQWSTRTAQCALPMNLMMEKALMFLWFWLLGCAAVLVCSAAVWAVRMLGSRRRQFVLAFLSISEGRTERQRRWAMADPELVGELAATDRAFLLRLVEERLGLAAAYLAMDAMLDRLLLREHANSADKP